MNIIYIEFELTDMDMNEFEKLMNLRKEYRNLDDKYKTPRFLKLYTKIYEYILSIPKDKIVLKQSLKYFCLYYIHCFLKAKYFYHWRERIYKLMTVKYGSTEFRKYELLYGQKAKEFFNEYLKNQSETYIEHYGCHPFQSEEVKEKLRNIFLERYGCENPFQVEEVKERIRQTNLERYGCENPNQSAEVIAKRRNTNIVKYGCEYGPWVCNKNNHSRIADEFCTNLYTKLPDDIKPYCIFFKKSNKEYMLEGNGKKYFYDFTIFMESIKVIVEFDGLYWHGLLEGQKDVRGVPVEEVWISDYEKERLAEMNGFKVIRVREDEYMVDKEMILGRVMEEILK